MTKHFTVPGSVVAVLAMEHLPFALFFNEGDDLIEDMRARQAELMANSQAIINKADAEHRDLTEAEQKEVDAQTEEFDSIGKQIALRERVAQQNAALTSRRGRQTDADDSADLSQQNAAQRPPAPRVPARPDAHRGNAGFYNFGDFALAVRRASVQGGQIDQRLQNAALSTYASEGTGADGGFAVPADFRSDILAPVFSEDSLVSRTDRLTSLSNTVTFPTDMTTPWGSAGVQAYWQAEAATLTQSKPVMGESTWKMHSLSALVPVTEELLEDAPAMGGYLARKAPEMIDFKLSNAIVRGTGVGQPLGFLNSPALVTQGKESAQTADTINAQNIVKMYSRLYAGSRATAAWIIHPDAEAQLPLMTIGNTPIYLPPGGLSSSPYGILYGRPVITHQVAETVGDLGDIMLVDLRQYLTITKTGNGRDANGVKQDVSMHLWFDQNTMAFRFNLRVAGQPWWPSAISPRDGSNTQSPFVVLETR